MGGGAKNQHYDTFSSFRVKPLIIEADALREPGLCRFLHETFHLPGVDFVTFVAAQK
jgi:hypothetical protein